MFSCTTIEHIYCTNTIQTVQSATELYLHGSFYRIFSCTTAQHIYCTNTVQTVQSVTELYLQKLQAAATCSAAQQHSAFTVQVLYKLYSLQLNCTYRNYKLLLHVQQHNSTAHLLYKYCTNCTVCN